MVYHIAPFLMTLSDLQLQSTTTGLLKCNFRTVVQQLKTFQLTQSVTRGFRATADGASC